MRTGIPTEVWVLLVRRADIPYLNRTLAGLSLTERHIREALHWNVRQIIFWLEPPQMPHDQALRTEFDRCLRKMKTRVDNHFVRVISKIDELTIHEAERAMAAPHLSLFSHQWISKWSASLTNHFAGISSFERVWSDIRQLPEMDEWKEARNSTVFYIPLSQEKDWGWAQKRLGVEIVEQSRSGFLGKNLNRKVSLWMSRFLVQFDVSPLVWTWVNIGFGVISAACLLSASYNWRAFGAVLFYWSCIFDGVDGEVSRFRFETSEKGALFDMAASWFNTLLFFGAVILSAVKTQQLSLATGQLLLVASALLLVALSVYFIRVVRVPLGQGAWSEWERKCEQDLRWWWAGLFFRKESFSLLAIIAILSQQTVWVAWGVLASLVAAWTLVLDVELRSRKLFVKEAATSDTVPP